MSANYAIYTSPNHQPIPDHLPTLIVTPQGKPHQILYTYLHTNYNQENYLLTPSDQGDLCVAKLFPPNHRNPTLKSTSSSSGHSHRTTPQSSADRTAIKCEASRNLRWTIRNEGIQHPVYKLTLPNPDNPQVEQPLFQVSKPNPNSPWWTLFYFTYAGHLIPPKRIEFGKIMKAAPGPKSSGETKISVTGKTEEEKAVWQTLGEGNEDMVEWILVCAALNVLDDEISKAVELAGVSLSTRAPPGRAPSTAQEAPSQQQQQQQRRPPDRQLHPTGNALKPVASPIRPAVYDQSSRSNRPSGPSPPTFHPVPAPTRAAPGQGIPSRGAMRNGPNPHHPSHPHPTRPYSPQQSPRGVPSGHPGPSARTVKRPPGSQPVPLRPEVLQDSSQLAYTRTPPNPSRSLTPVQHAHPHQISIASASHPPGNHHPHLPPGAQPPSAYYHPSHHPPPQNMIPPHHQAVARGSRTPIQPNNDYAIAAHTKQVR